MEFIVSSIIGALLGSLSASFAMIWHLRREDAKKKREFQERRADEREREKEELRDCIAIAEGTLQLHRNTEDQTLYNIERLERDVEEGEGGNLALHEAKELLLRERMFIMKYERDLINAKKRLEELDKRGGR